MSDSKGINEKIGMAKNFAKSILSRGLSNNKTDKPTKQLRVISCFGDGDELPSCEYPAGHEPELKSSKYNCSARSMQNKPTQTLAILYLIRL